jgi:K+-sensing histidine kinase KdpD
VVLVQDADSAFEEALLHQPHVLFIDEAIPPGGGIALCRRLKGNTRTHFIATVVVAHEDSLQHRLRALEAGADAVFSPAVDDQERLTRLWALLRSQALYRRQERRHRAQGDQLRQRGQWLGSFVHDLQNSLGALQANFEYLAQVVTRGATPDPETDDCVRDTRMVFAQVARGLRTVVDYERLESGRLRVREAALSLQRLAREAREELAATREDGLRQAITVEAPAARDLWTSGDVDLLRRALVAFGECILRQRNNTRLVIRVSGEGALARIALGGDGERFPREERDRLFRAYARLPRRAPLGQGLSLALARAVVEVHGGRVRVEDDDAEGGAAFLVELKSREPSPKLQVRE